MKIILAVACLTCALSVAWGASRELPEREKKFDRNHDGQLTEHELLVFFMHRNNPVLAEFDEDCDGELSATESKKMQTSTEQKANLDVIAWTQAQQAAPRQAPPDFDEMFPDTSPKPVTVLDQLWSLQIRRSLKDVDPYWHSKLSSPRDYATALPKVPPATFSFLHNFDDDGDAWTALGVIARPFVLSDARSSAIIPSVEFDRFEHRGDPKKERDSLVFRLGTDFGLPEIPQPNGVLAGNRLRVNAGFKTDTGIEKESWIGEVEWETSLGPLGGGGPLGSLPIAWYPRFFVRTEFGSRSDGRATLSEDEKDFFRYGPVLSLQLMPYFRKGWDNRFTARFEYSYLWSAKADHDAENLVAGLDWSLDERGHLKLSVEYRNGPAILDVKRVETVTVGVGVAF